MAKKIKGITIEIGGDVRPLDKALEDVNKKTRDLQGELRSVERLLKLDPKNTELLAQKQKLLADQVENSREKLERLRAAQEKVEEAFRKGEIGEEQYRHFQRQVINAEQELKKFEKQLRETGVTAEQLSKKLGETGKKMTDVGKDLSKKVTAPILGVGAAATKTGMEFEAAMSKVQALSGATAEEMAKLEKQAREMGAATVFSASEAAEAQAFLAMAGYDVAQIMDSLPGLLDLAAAGQLDLGRAADITTNIMSGFNIEAEKTTQVADVLAKAAASANTSVEQMGDAMSYVAPVAAGAGLSLEETAAAIGILSNAGIQGQRAGTALRGIIASLQNPTGQTAKALEALGLTVDDVNPSMHSLTDILRTLQEAGIDSAQAMQLAGTAAGPALIAMLSAGSDSLADFTDTLVNADGAAAEMAATMTDNLHGRIQEMKSAFEEVALTIYDNILPALEWLVQQIKALADWFNNLSPTMQNTIIVIAGIAAAIGPLLIVIGQMALGLSAIIGLLGKFSAASGAATVATTGSTAAVGGLKTMLTALTGPVGIAIAAITAFASIAFVVIKNWDPIKGFFRDLWEKVKEVTSNALEWFKGLPAKMAEIGKNLVEGLWNGINNMTAWIKDKVLGFVSGIAGTIKSFFGIESPSTLMQTYGQYIDEGLAKGIEENAHIPVNAMKNVATQVVSVIDELKALAGEKMASVYDVIQSGDRDYIRAYAEISRTGKTGTSGKGKTASDYMKEGYTIDSSGRWNTGAPAWLGVGPDGRTMSGGITQNITINSPTPLSPSETARQIKNASRQLAMEW